MIIKCQGEKQQENLTKLGLIRLIVSEGNLAQLIEKFILKYIYTLEISKNIKEHESFKEDSMYTYAYMHTYCLSLLFMNSVLVNLPS